MQLVWNAALVRQSDALELLVEMLALAVGTQLLGCVLLRRRTLILEESNLAFLLCATMSYYEISLHLAISKLHEYAWNVYLFAACSMYFCLFYTLYTLSSSSPFYIISLVPKTSLPPMASKYITRSHSIKLPTVTVLFLPTNTSISIPSC